MSSITSSSTSSPITPTSSGSMPSSFPAISSSTSSSPSVSPSSSPSSSPPPTSPSPTSPSPTSPPPTSPSPTSPSPTSPSPTSPSPTSLSSTSLSTNPLSSSSKSTPFSSNSPTSSITTPIRTSTSQESRTSDPVFGTSTSTQGQLAKTAPSEITSLLTSTASNGGLTTVTQVNPTLSAENSSGKGSAFFHNAGAVGGVFTLVGLAAATIFLWIFFAVRRRRRSRQLEHDTAVSATLAAAGFNRTPLDDDDNENGSVSRRSRFGSPEVEMGQRSSSGHAIGMNSSSPSGFFESRDREDSADPFNPYFDYIVQPGAHPGYVHARTGSPPHYHTGAEHANLGHAASYSAGSYEPLLASYYRTGPGAPSSPTVAAPNDAPPTPPPRNPQRLVDIQPPDGVGANRSAASSVYSSNSTGDVRLDPLLRQRLAEGKTQSVTARDPRDEEDYSRPVLGVRNMPDGISTEST